MATTSYVNGLARDLRFNTWAMLEYTALCAVLFACVPCIGVAASVCLALMALALAARWAVAAIVVFAAALLVAPAAPSYRNDDGWAPVIAVVVLGGTVCAWYWFHRVARD